MNKVLIRSIAHLLFAGVLTACSSSPEVAGPDAAVSAVAVHAEAGCNDCVATRVIDAEDYLMGGYVDHGYGRVDGPQHTVSFGKPFRIAVHEVTVGEFREFVAATGHVSEGICNIYTETTTWHIAPARNWQDPGFSQGEDHPVVCVSWDDAQAYIKWINQQTGRNYRLPSEAEWEYLTLHGGIGSGPQGTLTHAEGNKGRPDCCGGAIQAADRWLYTAPVGSFAADQFGLHDIRGNVWEWQADCYAEDYVDASTDGTARQLCADDSQRTIRGGSYGDSGIHQLPRFRLPGKGTQGYFTVGFRLAEDAS